MAIFTRGLNFAVEEDVLVLVRPRVAYKIHRLSGVDLFRRRVDARTRT